MICNLCPRNCRAERDENIGSGFCGLKNIIKIARSAPHMWEEPPISGTKGSGTIFFSGCTLRCVFCQNHEISEKGKGRYITVEELAEEFKELEALGVHNINLVSPTPYIPLIIKAFDIYKPSLPIVYNCGGYESVPALKSLKGYIDVYLPDFKYSSDILASQYSGADNYVKTAENAIHEMINQTGENEYNENGIIKKGVIIRHLVLPNHTVNSIGVLDLIKREFENTPVSLMGQYVPLHRAYDFKKLSRKITRREYEKVKTHMIDLGIEGYCQELNSASEEYIPDWDY